jgi:hypothetical protein
MHSSNSQHMNSVRGSQHMICTCIRGSSTIRVQVVKL